MPNKLPFVSIIVVGYNSRKYLKWCFDSIFFQTHPYYEVIYIDNCSSDDSLKFVKKEYPTKIKIIAQTKNLGYAGGQNLGIKISQGEFVLCLNPDIILDKNYLNYALRPFLKNPQIAAVTGKLLKYQIIENQNKMVNIQKTNIIDSCGLQIFKSHKVVEWGGGEINNKKCYDVGRQIFGVSGAAPIFRKSALEKIKMENQYFDSDFFAYKEDIDLSFRLLHGGFCAWFEPKALAWHHRWSTGSQKKETFQNIFHRRKNRKFIVNFLSYRNHLYFLLKNEFLSNLILYSPWIIFEELKKLIFGLLFDKSIIFGFLNFLQNLPLTLKKRYVILSKSKIKPNKIRRWLS